MAYMVNDEKFTGTHFKTQEKYVKSAKPNFTHFFEC